MSFRIAFIVFSVISVVAAQSGSYRVCIPSNQFERCQSLDNQDGRAVCESVVSRVDCALKLRLGTADIGVFSEEELLLLGQQQPLDNRVVASIRNIDREGPYAFEGVAVVSNAHVGGLEGLRGGKYCHPGLDETNQRWSPRVLRTLEQKAARTDRCPDVDTKAKTAEQVEVEQLSKFFTAGCRPGPWSANTNTDADLKRNNPSLCSLCGDNNSGTCAGYTLDMGVSISGANNNNRHIQALECLTKNGNGTVAFVAWQHVREYFSSRGASRTQSYALLCADGSLRALTDATLNSVTSPCSLVKQPWSAIVATSSRAAEIMSNLQTWWPNGANPGGNTWQAILYDVLVGGPGLKIVLEPTLPTPANYTSVRELSPVDSSTSCMPARRWCTTSALENTKCSWIRGAAYTLGIEPAISCQQRQNVFQCLEDIRDSRADFISIDNNYGFLARQHYKLSPVKLLRNPLNSPSRIMALVKESAAQSTITRFENLRGKKACFPEFGGIAYVTFVRTAHERSIISASECDYARAVGEFFDGACAPGAVDASHALNSDSSFNASTLCSACRPANGAPGSTCAWDYTNKYLGTNGTLACLADPSTDVAFLETQDIVAHLRAQNLKVSQFRVLCRNNTLAAPLEKEEDISKIDDNCLLALLVDGEVLARRSDPQFNSLSSLLEQLDKFFGYNAAISNQLVNLAIFLPFDGTSDLLFKDSAVGLTEPSSQTAHQPAKNYFELFKHLESCTGSAPSLAGRKGFWPIVTLIVATAISRWLM